MRNLKGVSEAGPCQKEYQWGTGVLSLYSRHEEGLHVTGSPGSSYGLALGFRS